LLILASVALICGILLFCVGLLGEVLIRIYHEGGARHLNYAIRSNRGADEVVPAQPDRVVEGRPLPAPLER
jgi:hypothetical protein